MGADIPADALTKDFLMDRLTDFLIDFLKYFLYHASLCQLRKFTIYFPCARLKIIYMEAWRYSKASRICSTQPYLHLPTQEPDEP
ncbi:unnamed protein product [Arabidopsis halleri]